MKIRFEILGGNLFSDVTGINVEASVEKYAELVEREIRAEYPTADVEVSYQLGVEGAGGGVSVVGDQLHENIEAIQNDVEAITERVFAEGLWYIMADEEAN